MSDVINKDGTINDKIYEYIKNEGFLIHLWDTGE